MRQSKPSNINITITPCSGPSSINTNSVSPGGATTTTPHNTVQAQSDTLEHAIRTASTTSSSSSLASGQDIHDNPDKHSCDLPASALSRNDATRLQNIDSNNNSSSESTAKNSGEENHHRPGPYSIDDDYYSDNEAESPRVGYSGGITRDHDLNYGQAPRVPSQQPHRQIRHADPPAAVSVVKSQKSRQKLQAYKTNKVAPQQNHVKQSHDTASQDSQGSRGPEGGHFFSHDRSNQPTSQSGDHQLGDKEVAGGQLEMYRSHSYMSRLSYERGFDDYEKQGGLVGGHYGSNDESTFRPNAEMESRVLKKLDRNLLPLLGVLYLFSYLDRVNIGNARLFGLEEDIKLTNGQYNIALASFFLAYCAFEMPSNMILVRVGPRVWIPILMLVWGGISLGLAWVTSFTGLIIARFALGAAEAGFVPGVLLYITLFYKRSEHSFRMAIFFCFNILAGAFGGLLAAGISHLSGKLGLQGWQWIFILEAIPTIFLAGVTWFIMSPAPEEAKFLTPEERVYASKRVLMDTDVRPTHKSSWKQTKSALTDVRVYLICACYAFLHTGSSGVVMFMPSLVADMGFKATIAQLLTTPIYLVAACFSLLIPWWSDRIQVRGLFIIFVPFISVTGFILLALAPWTWVKYFSVMLALCGMAPTSVVVTSWLTNNVIGHTKRATALAMLISAGGLGSMAGTQVYRTDDAPRYQRGHLIMASSIFLMIMTATLLRTIMARDNRRRDQNVASKGLTLMQFMSDGQFSEVGDHPNFRYTL